MPLCRWDRCPLHINRLWLAIIIVSMTQQTNEISVKSFPILPRPCLNTNPDAISIPKLLPTSYDPWLGCEDRNSTSDLSLTGTQISIASNLLEQNWLYAFTIPPEPWYCAIKNYLRPGGMGEICNYTPCQLLAKQKRVFGGIRSIWLQLVQLQPPPSKALICQQLELWFRY